MKLTSKKIRYGVVGLGYIAQTAVLPAFRNAEENSQLTVLISGDQEKLNTLGKKYNVENLYLYSEMETCFKSNLVDAIYISTPNFHHRDVTELAARYGIHVLCEKPMAVTSEDCLSMIQASVENKIKLMIAYRLHFEASNLEAIKLAHDIGDLKAFNSTFTIQVNDPDNIRLAEDKKGGGPLYDIGIYCINAARYLFQAEPFEVFAMSTRSMDKRFEKNEETISAILKFPDARLATFIISFGAFPSAEYDLLGSKGRLKLEQAYEYDSAMCLKLFKQDKVITKKFSKRDQFSPELLYFSDCIQKNKKPEPSGEEGLADIKVIEALLTSLKRRSPVQLENFEKAIWPDEQQKISRPPLIRPQAIHATGPGGEKH